MVPTLKNQFKTNISEIDTQHDALAKLVNELEVLVRSGVSEVAGQAMIDAIKTQTEQHFHEEEQLMAQSDYPGFEDHRLIHALLLENLQSVQDRLRRGELNLTEETVQFLRAWLMRHIIDSDVRFGEYYSAANAQLPSKGRSEKASAAARDAGIGWSDEYCTGIELVDDQHKNLVAMVVDLHTAIHERHGSEAARKVLNRLADYTSQHFSEEEQLMEDSDFPGLEDHKVLHKLLLDHVVDLQKKLDAGEAKISFELLHFLRVWLIRHINESDKRFGEYYVNLSTAQRKKIKQKAQAENRKEDPAKSRWRFW